MIKYDRNKCIGVFALALSWAFLLGCQKDMAKSPKTRVSIFVGVDVSGSFRSKPEFHDALQFLSYYLYAHLKGLGGLKEPKALFVGAIGGNYQDDPQVFRSTMDFEGRSVGEIQENLEKWFGEKDMLTDFNMFFQSVADLVKQRGLILSPISIVIVSDGITEGVKVKKGKAGEKLYAKINLKPLEYLARNVTLRLLYVEPKAGKNWEGFVPRKRVRIWTVPSDIMLGWSAQLLPDQPMEKQEKLFEWILYHIDYRVRTRKF